MSDCEKFRFALRRTWNRSRQYCLFIGLNPSTATKYADDPTIRRCVRFATDWGYGGLYMANLFAYRATQPEKMMQAADPTGFYNDELLEMMAHGAGVIVCAWGAHGSFLGRDKYVKKLLSGHNLMCLGVTKSGQPKHPLYLKADTPLRPYS
ncbi:DUF1643 domain-containing protein [Flavobacteriaceae bacterium]|nr:DUF1643 domain-containing protein [Flavobacteriaceae bacterium]